MTIDFATSNLSKIKPKLRTSGNISQPRRKAGSPLQELGITETKVIKCVDPDDYLNRMYVAFEKTEDPKLKQFIFTQIKKILSQRGLW
jgi:hypothetical protein